MMIIIFGFEFKDKYIFYSMLTRKQMWRRQKTCLKNETSDILKSTFIEELLFKKRVRWSLYVQVRYIPNRSELEPFSLWYEDDDYLKFKLDYEQQFGKDKYYTI